MKLLVLDTENKSIEVALASAVSTAQPHFVSTWADNSGTAFTEGSTDGVLNSTTDVTIVPAPAAGIRRVIKSIVVRNADDANVVLLVKYDNGTNQRTVVSVTLEPGDMWTLDGVFTSTGLFKVTVGTGGGGGSVNWGDIGGTLSNQTDLQAALDAAGGGTRDTYEPILSGTGGSAGAYAASVALGIWTLNPLDIMDVWGRVLLANKGSWTGPIQISIPDVIGGSASMRFNGVLEVLTGVTLNANTIDLRPVGTPGNSFLQCVQRENDGSSVVLPFSAISNNTDIRFHARFPIAD